ncbi:MAG: hypothetical protein KJ023_00090 [Burkholderiaceae bacterium]|jgi:hypothetical protein|nr:hypothetical protein [Burkholderiaceae bacterium]
MSSNASTPAGRAEARRTLELLQQQRRQWLEIEPGKRVRVVRPREAQWGRFAAGITVEHAAEFVDGWEGYTQADLVGAAVGSSDPVEFDAELWAEYVLDHAGSVGRKVVEALRDAIAQALDAREAAKGN